MTAVQGQLLHMLEIVAEAIGDDLRGRLVFVGGCTTALFVTDPIALEDVRATDDVDLIVDLAGYGEWARLQEQLPVNLGAVSAKVEERVDAQILESEARIDERAQKQIRDVEMKMETLLRRWMDQMNHKITSCT